MAYDSYRAIQLYLERGKNKDNRPAPESANNTRFIRTSNESVGIKLHKTVIIEYFLDGRIKLNTDGWKTVVTRERMNRWQNKFSVYQMNFIWYITYMGMHYLFVDNMVLHVGGKVTLNDELIKPYESAEIKEKEKLRGEVNQFCKDYIKRFFEGKIPIPSEKDCWDCLMRNTKTEETMGDSFNNHEHILSHINESYYVPSLLKNAIDENEKAGVYGLAPIDKNNIACIWGNHQNLSGIIMAEITIKRLKLILKRYISKRVGLGVT